MRLLQPIAFGINYGKLLEKQVEDFCSFKSMDFKATSFGSTYVYSHFEIMKLLMDSSFCKCDTVFLDYRCSP